MSLLQIHEPGQTPEPHADENNIAVGIDLGTTNSLVAVLKEGKPEIIKDKNGNSIHPSVVNYLNGETSTGHDAKQKKSGQTIASVKRLMGKGEEDIKLISGKLPYKIQENTGEGMVRLDIEGVGVTPVQISAQILKSLKEVAKESLGTEVAKAVITVPAYFDDTARAATKDAAKLAGLEVLRLVNEPTAAALAYGLDKEIEGIYAVYDLGGGTFDISILKMEKGVFQVLSTGGSTQIGGDDFDREIAEIILWDYKKEIGKAINPDEGTLTNILDSSRKIKEELSEKESAAISLEIKGVSHKFTIDKAKFEQVIEPYIDATVKLCEQAVADAKISMDEVKGVVLVGGSTRVPLVKQKIAEFFGDKILDDVNPDEVVAVGAALQADGLTKGWDNLLLDVLPLSLGIETMGGLVEKVIHRNTPIPVSKAQEFTTYQDGQSGMIIHVVQGEREMVQQNRSLAKFELKGIPDMVAGAARIKVTFNVDADGLLTVSAKEETTSTQQTVEVKPSYGLSEGEIKQMLYESMARAKDDMEERLLSESKVEAQRVIMAVNSAMDKDGSILEEDERGQINESLASLKEALSSKDRDEITNLTECLIKTTESFASKRMNKYIGDSLKGKNVEEIE